MRLVRPIGALVGLLAIGGVVAGCGAATHNPGAATGPPVPRAGRPAPPISFLAPARAALVGSTVLARVKVSRNGGVRFMLDAGRPRVIAGSAITYRHLASGRHRLVARLLSFSSQRVVAAASTRFDVRPPAPGGIPQGGGGDGDGDNSGGPATAMAASSRAAVTAAALAVSVAGAFLRAGRWCRDLAQSSWRPSYVQRSCRWRRTGRCPRPKRARANF